MGRKLTGDITLEELQELEQYLLKDSNLASNVELHATYFETTTENDNDEQFQLSWQKQLERLRLEFPGEFGDEKIEETGKNSRVIPLFAWMGAAVLIVSGFFLWVTNLPNTKNLAGVSEKTEKKRVTLPDGTLVWLNKNSTISYDGEFGIHNRDIVLNGEAFFDVVHKAELPMNIHAGPVNIKVKGTAFNVAAYTDNNKVETSLIRGVIELSVKNKPDQRILMKPNEKITVTYNPKVSEPTAAAQAVVLAVDPLITETQTGLIPEVAWIENKLVFSNESFASVAEKIGRWYDVKLLVVDKKLAEEKFTGAFDKETLDQALNALQMTYDFKFKKDAEGTIIISQN